MMKRYLLLYVVLLSMTRAFSQIHLQEGRLWFEVTSANTVSVYTKSGVGGELKIPATVTYAGKQYTVTAIKSKGLSKCFYVNSLIIPNTVTTIGDSVFGFDGSMLESLTIPSSVTKIGTDAFLGLHLKSIVVEEGNKFYDSRNNCNALIETRTNTLLKASNNAFIPNGVRRIEQNAFCRCDSISEINMPNTVTSVGDWAFAGCRSLKTVKLSASLTDIGKGAFSGVPIESIILPNSLKTIGERSFEGSSLHSLEIPASVTNIGREAFGWNNLVSIAVEKGNKVYDSRDNCNAVIETQTNTLTHGCGRTTIPTSVTAIGDDAFCGCQGMTTLTIPHSVTDIGSGAFSMCDLKAITLPNSVKHIGAFAFQYYKLNDESSDTVYVSVNIPDSVETIGECAFYYCDFCDVTIPASVTKMGRDPFDFRRIKSIVVDKANKVYDSRNNCNAIIETETNTLLNACQNTTIPNSVRTIGEFSFGYLRGLESVMIPASVTEIKDYAFVHCYELRDVKIMGTVNFGNDCFVFCDSLKKMTYLTPLVLEPVNLGWGCNIDTLYVLKDMVPMFKQTDLWKNIPNILPYTLPVDVNTDGIVNSTDVVALYNIIGKGGGDAEQKLRADVNGDGTINSADVVTVYNYIVDGK